MCISSRKLLKFLAMNWNALINFPNFARICFLVNLFTKKAVEHKCNFLRNLWTWTKVLQYETHTMQIMSFTFVMKCVSVEVVGLFYFEGFRAVSWSCAKTAKVSHKWECYFHEEKKIVFARQKFCLQSLDLLWIFKLSNCRPKQSQLS